mgnify:CR=1 FL=1
MYSPAIDLTTSDTSELSFYFHAYGAKMGTLNVKVGSSSLGYTTVYTLSGQQQTSNSAPWQNVTVDLSAILGEFVHLEFEYTSQVGQDCFTGDIAIDNITVSQSTQYSYSPEIGIMGKREFNQPYVYDWEYNIFGATDTRQQLDLLPHPKSFRKEMGLREGTKCQTSHNVHERFNTLQHGGRCMIASEDISQYVTTQSTDEEGLCRWSWMRSS